MNDTNEIVSEFLAESRQHLDRLEHDLVELERYPRSSELIAGIFRAIHTIKGACGFLGFGRLELLIQAEEALLGQMRSGLQRPDSEKVALLLAAVDRTRAVLSEIEVTGADGHGKDSDLIERLTGYTIPHPASDMPPEEADKPLGQLLAEAAGVSQGAIEAALEAQKSGDARRIGEILVEQGVASRSLIRNVLEHQTRG
jgi:two-component system chemotaxis sensor kinase CheA